MSVEWEVFQVSSPSLPISVEVIAAKDIPYVQNGHRYQTSSIYVPRTDETSQLVGQAATKIPTISADSDKPRWHVHIHGGAWRHPSLTSSSVEPLIACAFESPQSPIEAIVSLNYTISAFPTHPTDPYDPSNGDSGQPWREAKHPDHIRDILTAFKVLRTFGLKDDSYLLSGHSCGACLAFQATLQDPKHWGLSEDPPPPPRPFTLIGLNGLYDLPAPVHGLGASHNWTREDYDIFLKIAFGKDELRWPLFSPAHFDSDMMTNRVQQGSSPNRVILDQSSEDQLVPLNQLERMKTQLEQVSELQIIRGNRCVGKHAEPWERGHMIWETILDALK